MQVSDLPGGFKTIRFHSGRVMPRGANFKVSLVGPIVFVEGSVPGGPVVRAPCAVVEQDIVLDDSLFFYHEFLGKQPRIQG
jgi:hypothetical protein